MSIPPVIVNKHVWGFIRWGGLDQVSLQTGADLLNLQYLDQKLWVALVCPVKGLELDEQTLALIDTDKDGYIRVPEVLGAIKWASAYLRDVGDLLKRSDELPLSAINEATAAGKTTRETAQRVLERLGKADAKTI